MDRGQFISSNNIDYQSFNDHYDEVMGLFNFCNIFHITNIEDLKIDSQSINFNAECANTKYILPLGVEIKGCRYNTTITNKESKKINIIMVSTEM